MSSNDHKYIPSLLTEKKNVTKIGQKYQNIALSSAVHQHANMAHEPCYLAD